MSCATGHRAKSLPPARYRRPSPTASVGALPLSCRARPPVHEPCPRDPSARSALASRAQRKPAACHGPSLTLPSHHPSEYTAKRQICTSVPRTPTVCTHPGTHPPPLHAQLDSLTWAPIATLRRQQSRLADLDAAACADALQTETRNKNHGVRQFVRRPQLALAPPPCLLQIPQTASLVSTARSVHPCASAWGAGVFLS